MGRIGIWEVPDELMTFYERSSEYMKLVRNYRSSHPEIDATSLKEYANICQLPVKSSPFPTMHLASILYLILGGLASISAISALIFWSFCQLTIAYSLLGPFFAAVFGVILSKVIEFE